MKRLKKTSALVLAFCMVISLMPAITLPAAAIPIGYGITFPGESDPGYDADKVFFNGETLEFTITGLTESTDYLIEFGIVGVSGDFISTSVGTECVPGPTDGISNYISTTTGAGITSLTLTPTIAEDLDNGMVAIKLYASIAGVWTELTGGSQPFIALKESETRPVIVGLDSIFSSIPASPDELLTASGPQAGYWATDAAGAAIDEVNNLYDTSAVFGKVIYDEDGDYSTYGDMTYGTIYFSSLNFMDQGFMTSLADLFENITMEQQAAESFDAFTMGINTEQITFLADIGATVSITSPYFEWKSLTADSFDVEPAAGQTGTVVGTNFADGFDGDGVSDTFEFGVTHFSDFDVELTYSYSGVTLSGGLPLEGVVITLLDRYLEPVGEFSATSDTDGEFEILNIPGGKYYVKFTKDGYIYPLDGMWDTAEDGNYYYSGIALQALVDFSFTVTDGGGAPIEQAQIVFDPNQGINAFTDENGTVTTSAIPLARCKVTKEGYKPVSLNSIAPDQSVTLKKQTYLTLTANKTHDIAFGEQVTFTASLKDIGGVGIEGQTLSFGGDFTGDDGIYDTVTGVTDANGEAVFTVTIGETNPNGIDCYYFDVSYAGNVSNSPATQVTAPVVIGADPTPVEITTAEELAAIDDTDESIVSNYILANDIDMTDYLADTDWYSIDSFYGILDGNGKTLTGFSGYYPLFYNIYAPAVVKNLNIEVTPGIDEDDFDSYGIFAYQIGYEDEGPVYIENVDISGSTYNDCCGTVAGFAAEVYGIATITDCDVAVNIATTYSDYEYSGGFIGHSGGQGSSWSPNTDILIKDCSFTGSFNGGDEDTAVYGDNDEAWGGFIGDNNIGSVIENCYVSASLYFDGSGYGGENRFGGFAGRNAGTIRNSYATGTLKVINNNAYNTEDTFVGGLVGRNVGTVSNCFANMDIDVAAECGSAIGGLIGSDTSKALVNSYAAGTIAATADYEEDIYVGGVIGCAMVKSSFWHYYSDDFGLYESELYANLDNTYYDSLLADVGIGAIYDYNEGQFYFLRDASGEAESKTAAQMKTAAFASNLNNSQSPAAWNLNVDTAVNVGYPVPAWVSVSAPVYYDYTPAPLITENTLGNHTTVTSAINSTAATVTAYIGAGLLEHAKAAEAVGQKVSIIIDITGAGAAASLKTDIPRSLFDQIANETNADLTVDTGLGMVTFDAAAVASISGAATPGDITIGIEKVDPAALTEGVRQRVGDRPVYDFSVTAGGTLISSFGGGHANISIPYTLRPGEDKNAIVVYYIDDSGVLKTIRGAYNAATSTVEFTTTHFSEYAVGYNKVNFTDVAANAWYKSAVDFISARSITTGIGNNMFGPENKLTRGQFIVMLMRSYDIAPDNNPTVNFADAGNTYYTGYLAAAKRLGISNGMGNNMYAPDGEISRQDMFTLLYRAMNMLGELPTATTGNTVSNFSDAGQISDYALTAMKTFVESGIVSGSDGKLNPSGMSNRAQMAQVLYNLLSK